MLLASILLKFSNISEYLQKCLQALLGLSDFIFRDSNALCPEMAKTFIQEESPPATCKPSATINLSESTDGFPDYFQNRLSTVVEASLSKPWSVCINHCSRNHPKHLSGLGTVSNYNVKDSV